MSVLGELGSLVGWERGRISPGIYFDEEVYRREHARIDNGEAEQQDKQGNRQHRAPEPLARQQLAKATLLGRDGQLDIRHGLSSVG